MNARPPESGFIGEASRLISHVLNWPSGCIISAQWLEIASFSKRQYCLPNCGVAEQWIAKMSWTEDRVNTLLRLREEGKTSSQIAEALGGTTRNAVIGKIFRLGLAKPTKKKPAEDPAEQRSSKRGNSAEKRTGKTGEAETASPDRSGAETGDGASAESDFARSVEDASHVVGMDETMTLVKQAERDAKKLNLLELTERTCKWPVGDPSTDDFWFCGLPSKAGKPYCEAHIGLAFQPFTSRRDNRSGVSKT